MNRGNKLWEGHRMMIPGFREKAITTCRHCIFLVDVTGREETRKGCLAGIKEYGSLRRRVPLEIHGLELLLKLGRTGLDKIIARGSNPDAPACGSFRPRDKS